MAIFNNGTTIYDTVDGILTTILNAEYRGSDTVQLPVTCFTKAVARILLDQKLIQKISKRKKGPNIFFVLTLLDQRKREGTYRPSFRFYLISAPSGGPAYCKYPQSRIIIGGSGGRPVYCKYPKIPKILIFDDIAIVLLSTCRGIMTGEEARLHKIQGMLKMLYCILPTRIL